jgi:RecA/RadA recombinase
MFEDLIKASGNKYAVRVEDMPDTMNWIDTGSYTVNFAFSGSIFGGVADNKITMFAGESATGKTFFILGCAQSYLRENPTAGVMYFETEGAVTKKILTDRGIDPKRFITFGISTIEEFRSQVKKIVDAHLAKKEKDRRPIMICLDSLGALSTNAGIEKASDADSKKDMSKQGLIKQTLADLSLEMTRANVPLLITNHVYKNIGGYGPVFSVYGGSGPRYFATSIGILTKAKDTQGKVHTGNIITLTMDKSRLSKEGTKVKTKIDFTTGLDRYYGLLEFAEASGLVKKVGNRWQWVNSETAQYESAIYKNPEKYFTQERLEIIDKYVQENFTYGGTGDDILTVEEEVSE